MVSCIKVSLTNTINQWISQKQWPFNWVIYKSVISINLAILQFSFHSQCKTNCGKKKNHAWLLDSDIFIHLSQYDPTSTWKLNLTRSQESGKNKRFFFFFQKQLILIRCIKATWAKPEMHCIRTETHFLINYIFMDPLM